VLLVNGGLHPEASMLDAAFSLTSRAVDREVIVAVSTDHPLLPAPADPTLSYLMLPDLSADSLFEAAMRSRCDLIVARPPGELSFTRFWLRQLLFGSPCPVCLVPEGATLSFERALVRLSLTPRGSRLLSLAASLVRSVGGEELLAVHNSFDYEVDEQPDLADCLRTRDELAIYRFLARINLSGMNVSPVREARPGEGKTLLAVARRRGADLLIVDPGADGGPVWQWNRREVLRLAAQSEIALLSTGLANEDRGWMRILREQVFTEQEPKFG
jgi:hypothetical protein